MKVKELIEKLQSFDPEAIVASETFYDWQCSDGKAWDHPPGITIINDRVIFYLVDEPSEINNEER